MCCVKWYVLCLACGFALACAPAAHADEPALLTVDWKERAERKVVSNGEVIEIAGDKPDAKIAALKVVSSVKPGEKSANPTIHLTTIEKPGITKRTFALKGRIQHKGVEATGYLEMWVVLPDGSQYFSRTLGSVGPMKSLSGDSDWREIALPFQLSDDPKAPKPSKLIINVVLPASGEIVLSNMVCLRRTTSRRRCRLGRGGRIRRLAGSVGLAEASWD
jgi:hypothetical protein